MGIIPLKGRTIEVLSPEEIQQVHQAVLELLRDPGVLIRHEEALDIFQRGGADVDKEKQTAHPTKKLWLKIFLALPCGGTA